MPVTKFTIIGKYAQGTADKFVAHLAMAREDSTVTLGAEVPSWEMQPPLASGSREATCTAHVAAWMSLTADEREGITDWLAEVDKENRPAIPSPFELLNQYTLSNHPDEQWHRDEKEVPIYRKFNCVTFVLGAYRVGAGIQLLDVEDPSKLPELDLVTIATNYEIVNRIGRWRERIGLRGNGPWCVPLPGYVCHAMNRADEVIRSTPYRVPGPEAARFPLTAPKTSPENTA